MTAWLTRRGLDAALVVALLALWGVGIYRAQPTKPDWKHWEEEVAVLLTNGRLADNTALYGYVPGFVMWLIPIAGWLPRPVGAAVLGGLSLTGLVIAAALVNRYWVARQPPTHGQPLWGGPAPAHNPLWQALGGPVLVLMGVAIYDPIFANQLSLWILGALVAGLTLVHLGWSLGGGVCLGLAAAIKPPAGFLLLYVLWKRQLRAALGWWLGLAVFAGLPALIYYGPRQALDEHLAWLGRASQRGHGTNFDHPLRFKRNQASSVVAVHWLSAPPAGPLHVQIKGTPDAATEAWLDRASRDHEITIHRLPHPIEGPFARRFELSMLPVGGLPRLWLVDLDTRGIKLLWALAMIALTAGLLWVTAGPRTDPSSPRPWAESAVWMIAIFAYSPLMYHNYLIWALPGVAILWGAAWPAPWSPLHGSPPSPWTAQRVVAAAALGVWVASVATRGQWWAEYYGVNLLASLVVAVAVVIVSGLARPLAADSPTPQPHAQR